MRKTTSTAETATVETPSAPAAAARTWPGFGASFEVPNFAKAFGLDTVARRNAELTLAGMQATYDALSTALAGTHRANQEAVAAVQEAAADRKAFLEQVVAARDADAVRAIGTESVRLARKSVEAAAALGQAYVAVAVDAAKPLKAHAEKVVRGFTAA